jgi:hypothetical protein
MHWADDGIALDLTLAQRSTGVRAEIIERLKPIGGVDKSEVDFSCSYNPRSLRLQISYPGNFDPQIL